MLHYIQVIIGEYVEYIEDLIKHLAMLSSNTNFKVDGMTVFLNLFDHRCHFYCFRARTEYDENISFQSKNYYLCYFFN